MEETSKNYNSAKPPRTADELVKKLRERGLIINEEEELTVKNTIRSKGYYRLSGYFRPLQSPKDVFKENTTFNDIIRLYDFDRKLRLITNSILKLIEVDFRTKFSDIMSLAYGSDWYFDERHFKTNKTYNDWITVYNCNNGEIEITKERGDIKIYSKLVEEIKKCIDRNDDKEYIVKFKSEYGNEATVPSWMVMECISFGTISRLFTILNAQEKKSICRCYNIDKAEILSSWLHALVILRNSCAHHSRIWNTKTEKSLRLAKNSNIHSIADHEDVRLMKLYGVVGCALFLLKEIDYDYFIKYKKLFYRLVKIHDIHLGALGFPDELLTEDIWKQ